MPTARDFMTTNVITIDSHGTVLEAAKLMHQQDVGDLVVIDGVEAKGIVTANSFPSFLNWPLFTGPFTV